MKLTFLTPFLFLIGILSTSFTIDPNTNGAIRSVNYDIFGKKYAKTAIIDNQLKGHVYYVVSGHGGPDPGAMFKKDGKWLCEDEYAYDVSLRLARNLISHGALVYMITRDDNDGIRDEVYLAHDTEETVYGGKSMPLNQAERLRQRSNVINELYETHKRKGYKTQRTIITHIDSRYVDKKVDVFFYHKENNTEGRELAKSMYHTIKNKYDEKQKGRGYYGEVSSRNLHMLRETKPTAVFMELGNICNEFDQKRLLMPDNRQAMANWLCQGILNYN